MQNNLVVENELFTDPDYRPSLLTKVKQEHKSLQRKEKKIRTLIFFLENFNQNKKVTKDDLQKIDSVLQPVMKKKILSLLDLEKESYDQQKIISNLEFVSSVANNSSLIPNNTKIIVSNSIKPRANGDIIKDIMKDKTLTASEKDTSIALINLCSTRNLPLFEIIKTNFLLKSIYMKWLDVPKQIKEFGAYFHRVSISYIVF